MFAHMERPTSGTAAVLTAICIIAVATGCAPRPGQAEIEERFAIEIASLANGFDKDDAKVRELAVSMSENAEHDCHSPTYWALQRDDLQYVHAAACTVLYDDIDPALQDEYNRVIVDWASR